MIGAKQVKPNEEGDEKAEADPKVVEPSSEVELIAPKADVDLSSFGGPDPDFFKAFKWVISRRKAATLAYLTEKELTKQRKEKERSSVAKCGSMVKTLLMYGAVAGVVGPMIYALYKEKMQGAEANEFEEMARRASSAEE